MPVVHHPDFQAYVNGLRVKMKMRRHERGLSQIEVARRIGMKSATMNRFENGPDIPSLSVLYRLAKLYDTDFQIK